MNFVDLVGPEAARFLNAFIETEMVLFTRGRTMPAVRELQLARREEELVKENED